MALAERGWVFREKGEMQIRKKRQLSANVEQADSATVTEPLATFPVGEASGAVSPDERKRMIEQAAYFRAQKRGFMGGSPITDWLEAEAEISSHQMRSAS
jgi:hypothetical protein